MRFAALALFACSAPAIAATPIDKMLGSIGSVTMDNDRADVVLYSDPDGDPVPSVQVLIGENQYLFRVDVTARGVYAGPRLAKAEELKVRTGNKKLLNLKGESNKYRLGGERKYAELGEMRIGGLVLNDVVVATTEWDKNKNKKDWRAPEPSGTSYDGAIGLRSLPDDVSWALQPSKAQISFARGEAVAGLASEGITVPYQEFDGAVVKYGPAKEIQHATSLIVDMSIGGVVLPTVLAPSYWSSLYVTEEPIKAAVNGRKIDVFTRYHELLLSGQSLGKSWFGEFTDLPEYPMAFKAILGNDVLNGYDIIVDRNASTVTLSRAESPSWTDPRPFLLAEALKAVEPAAEEEGEAASTEEAPSDGEADAKPPGNPGAWKALKDLYVSTGDLNKAIEAQNNVIAFDDQNCKAWISLGHLHRDSGDPASAITAYEAASKSYHAWYGLSLEEREEIEKARKKMDEDEKKASEHKPADSSCHTADGHLAAATFSAGDLNTIETLYRANLDLDQGLALMTANALITKGEYARAQEPLRQAIKMRSTFHSSEVRLALALVYANAGDWGQASALFQRSLSDRRNTQSTKVWLDALRASQGPDSVLKAAAQSVEQNPLSHAAHYGHAYALAQSGTDADRKLAKAAGERVFRDSLEENPRKGTYWAAYSRWLNVWGDVDAAEEAAKKAVELSPGESIAMMAMAEVYEAKEEFALAQKYTLKAAQSDPFHPGYARLISTLSE